MKFAVLKLQKLRLLVKHTREEQWEKNGSGEPPDYVTIVRPKTNITRNQSPL